MEIFRIYAEKKEGFDISAKSVCQDLRENLGIKGLTKVRILVRYDISGITEEEYEKAKYVIFSEPMQDFVYDEAVDLGDAKSFVMEYLPGQYDQRADSAAQCVQVITGKERPVVKTAMVYAFLGNVSDEELLEIKKYLINPVEAREAKAEKPQSLVDAIVDPEDVAVITGFISADEAALKAMLSDYGFAMDFDDISFCQKYFKEEEQRDPTLTELRMIDTYWSDHCRHTTFATHLTDIKVEDELVNEVYKDYCDARISLGRTEKPICLMDIATIAAKELKKMGYLKNIDESEEINACSIEVEAEVNGKKEAYLIMFKNETHNHPTEIEPFGGAATCLGGAIRDPLSGRSYVYQAMRITGSGDPRKSLKETLPGKLPQRKISKVAAKGYSSYGNQIGLATGLVREVYDEGYVAKRLEIGAVVGAVPKANVVRERPQPGDKIILLGGRTGRDGCGGATGSSKAHTMESLESCGAEVQKGNPPEERKIQRLMRKKEVTTLIKRCNDFGAGGVSVAIGELCDGLIIQLDKVPKKYEGLDGTELAISESQERMAVVVAAEDVEKFMAYAKEENLEATLVADVTDTNRLEMYWRGNKIVNLSRTFLNSNGASKQAKVTVPKIELKHALCGEFSDLSEMLSDLNICSQKGLIENFDSTIGAATVLMPFGGAYELTPEDVMAAKIPIEYGDTTTATVMSYGYNSKLSATSTFHGAYYAVIESVARIIAAGAKLSDTYLTFQEYFERLREEPTRWGKPFAALLGAYHAQKLLKIAAIGGKDSMSGSFNEMDVPPTLVSFAIAPVNANTIISREMKQKNSKVYLLKTPVLENGLLDVDAFLKNVAWLEESIENKTVISASAVSYGGVAEAVTKMLLGNKIGFTFSKNDGLFDKLYGSFVVETCQELDLELIGSTNEGDTIECMGKTYLLSDLADTFEKPLAKVYPPYADNVEGEITDCEYKGANIVTSSVKVAKPKVFIPVFPGSNCEYDSARRFEKAGAEPHVMVFKNLTVSMLEESVEQMAKQIEQSQIMMIPGGFSGGDEPDGSGKFISAVLRNPKIKEAIQKLLYQRDGLMLGICNGFQALIKLGLVPYGDILEPNENWPTLTFNTIPRHISTMVDVKVTSNLSPWLMNTKVGDVYKTAISHGEGRFTAPKEVLSELIKNGQIATQYVDLAGNPTYDSRYNPNGSLYSIEGITSKDGRIFGKMGHSERIADNLYKNIDGSFDMKLFESGVAYFK
ncbi:MAG: phosphoribosylformylglycinamidine synthase [Clostridia bacterium]|nr:phosphoribosylformylglycinamidine synthase [Clostridia bacterium]